MALTQDEVRRWSAKFGGSVLLDTNLKPDALKGNVNALVDKIMTKLKLVKVGGKLVVFWSEAK